MHKVRMTREERRERRREIAMAVKAGEDIVDLLARFDCSYSLISAACKEFGVSIVAPKRETARRLRAGLKNTSSSKIRIVARIINSREPFAEIAREFGLTRARVEQIAVECRAAGIRFPRRPRGGAALAAKRSP